MRSIYVFTFSILGCFVLAQLPADSISYEYFYEKELQEVVRLKQELKQKPEDLRKAIAIAELYDNINIEDSAYAAYYRVFYKMKHNKADTDTFNEVLLELHLTESSKRNYDKDRRYFLQLLYENAIKAKTDKWLAYYHNEVAKDHLTDSTNYEQALRYFWKAQNSGFYKEDTLFQTKVLLNIGYNYNLLKQYGKAQEYLERTLHLALANEDYLRQVYAHINLAVNYIEQEKYEEALVHLETAEKIPNTQYKIKIFRIIYRLKGDAYYGLKNDAGVEASDKIYHKLDSLINDFQRNSNFYEIDTKYQTKEKNQKIASLTSIEQRFVRNKVVYGILIFLVFLLALYSFVRWKKVDLKKKRLLQEKNEVENLYTETVIELNKVRQLVTEDYIVLKNKSKVYLKELLYVKSENHYLEIYTVQRKELLRGKISELLQQLPPNFVQTHRSYIVNKNFITSTTATSVFINNTIEIPVSRSYKKNL